MTDTVKIKTVNALVAAVAAGEIDDAGILEALNADSGRLAEAMYRFNAPLPVDQSEAFGRVFEMAKEGRETHERHLNRLLAAPVPGIRASGSTGRDWFRED